MKVAVQQCIDCGRLYPLDYGKLKCEMCGGILIYRKVSPRVIEKLTKQGKLD
jgi:rRNA maturation endonuclease Nob1